jgi:hypothetical protein
VAKYLSDMNWDEADVIKPLDWDADSAVRRPTVVNSVDESIEWWGTIAEFDVDEEDALKTGVESDEGGRAMSISDDQIDAGVFVVGLPGISSAIWVVGSILTSDGVEASAFFVGELEAKLVPNIASNGSPRVRTYKWISYSSLYVKTPTRVLGRAEDGNSTGMLLEGVEGLGKGAEGADRFPNGFGGAAEGTVLVCSKGRVTLWVHEVKKKCMSSPSKPRSLSSSSSLSSSRDPGSILISSSKPAGATPFSTAASPLDILPAPARVVSVNPEPQFPVMLAEPKTAELGVCSAAKSIEDVLIYITKLGRCLSSLIH